LQIFFPHCATPLIHPIIISLTPRFAKLRPRNFCRSSHAEHIWLAAYQQIGFFTVPCASNKTENALDARLRRGA